MVFPFRLVKRSQHYNVANKDLFVIPIELLTNECIECTLFSTSIGQDALHNVAQKINLQQPEYFGLLFKSRKNVDQWVDLSRPLKKQLDKHAMEVRLYFRLQYFVPNFHFLTDEASRYHYFCAMKGLVIDGRIACSRDDAILLASFSLQAEFGDYTPERHTVEYLNNFALFPKSMVMSKIARDVLVECAINAYRNLQGVPTNVAEIYYISEAQQREGYGQEGFPARDPDHGHDVCLGVCIRGIFVVNTETNTVELFKWMDIANLIHHKKVFTIERNADNYRKNYSTFDSDYASCIWRVCVEQHQFFMKGIQTLNDVDHQQQQQLFPGITSGNNGSIHPNLQNPMLFMPNSAELFAQLQQQQQQPQSSHPSESQPKNYQPNGMHSGSIQQLPLSNSIQQINSNSLQQMSNSMQHIQLNSQAQQVPQLPVPFYETVDSATHHHIAPGPIQKSQSLIENVNMEPHQPPRPRTSTEPPIELSQIQLNELNNEMNDQSSNSTPIYENAPNPGELSLEQRKALLPAYKSPPDYETFLKQRQRYANSNSAAVLAAARAMCLSQSLSSIPSRLASHNQINSASSSSSLAIGQPGQLPHHLQSQPHPLQNGGAIRQLVLQHPHNASHPSSQTHPNNQLVNGSIPHLQQSSTGAVNQQNLHSIYKNYTDLSMLASQNSGSVQDFPKSGMFTASSPELNNLFQKRVTGNNTNNESKSVHFRTPEPLLNHESNLRKSKLQSAFASVPDLTFSARHTLENIYENPSDYALQEKSSRLKKFSLFNFAPKNLRLLNSHASAGSEPNLLNTRQNPLHSNLHQSTPKLSTEQLAFLTPESHHPHLQQQQQQAAMNVYSPAHHQSHKTQQPPPPPSNRAHFPSQAIYANLNGSSAVAGNTHHPHSSASHHLQQQHSSVSGIQLLTTSSTSLANTSATHHGQQSQLHVQQQQQHHQQHPAPSQPPPPPPPITVTASQPQQPHPHHMNGNYGALHSTISPPPTTTSTPNTHSDAGNSSGYSSGSTIINISSTSNARFLSPMSRVTTDALPSINDHLHQHSQQHPTNNTQMASSSQKSTFTFQSNSRLVIFNTKGVQDHEFTREFELLPRMNPIAKFTTASLPENVYRNRFRDILPYEENRVKLSPTKENKHGYVNASSVKMVFDGGVTQSYVAAQGPLPNTTLDFWQMVWEKCINLIVMVTNFTESGTEKCFIYLPLRNEPGKNVARFGDFEITCNYTSISPTYITSFLSVSHGNEKRTVTHLRYTDWNDHSIPGDLQGFLSFLAEMDSIYRRSSREGSGFGKKKSNSSLAQSGGPPPILVHCSAGAGRSGVVILCDALLKYLDHNLHEPIDIPKALIQLRFQRMISVQHCEQFRFVCQVLSQHLANSRLI